MTGRTETVELDRDVASALKTRAAARGISVSELVAELVSLSADEAALAELERRWATVEGGEMTVAQADVERWLATWGTSDFRAWPDR